MNNLPSSIVVPENWIGERIDKAVAALLPEYSRSQLSNWLKEGIILCNGQLRKPKDKIVGICELSIDVERIPALNTTHQIAENIPLDIVYEDEYLLVVHKPPGLVVHPGAGNSSHTLMNALLYYHPPLQSIPRAGLIHRLDKDTSGLLLVAKTLATHTYLIRQMQERQIQREYLAVVEGRILSSATIETYFGRHSKNRLKMAVCDSGKEAITHYRVIERFAHFTLLRVKLETGRTHQIRVHLAHIKHPIIGDRLYGRLRLPKQASEILRETLMHLPGQVLHAVDLTFTHPESHEQIHCHAPMPDSLTRVMDILRTG
ncbi:MAG: 23S rRNA pseudouridine(1911/1915/1917) synthase RluD [Legionellaceae bacterium]|nr:23S rRNA pseudouridine(1911/1915/1917) synthase RluD [Legionellaceae bacterium]